MKRQGPILGMSIRNLTPTEQSKLEIKGGVYVQDVTFGGLAAQSRIIPGDIITQINNKKTSNMNEFVEAVAGLQKDSVARVSIIRQGQHAMLGLRIQ